MKRLLELPATERPTAVFCGNDQSALGAYRAICEAGLRVPEDISVVGFDDIEEAADFAPPLTTVAQDWEAMGAEMIRVAQETLDGGAPQNVVLPARLVVRESTAPPRA
jgi:DNA-binding LacI/PurR family transcriptional regulator